MGLNEDYGNFELGVDFEEEQKFSEEYFFELEHEDEDLDVDDDTDITTLLD